MNTMIQPTKTLDYAPPAETKPQYRPGHARHLAPTKRGWLFMGRHGGPCDKACKMCYYAYQSQLTFFTLDTLMKRANMFRHRYGLQYCDISGGEATIYGPKVDGRRPQLEALLTHCRNIGLLPTIITHGQNNTQALVEGVEGAGLEDWLISLHGMTTGHEATVVDHKGRGEGGWERVVAGLQWIKRPVRFNSTLQNFNYREMPDLARWLRDNRPATVWNMIQFNPFFAWTDKPEIDFQATMDEMGPYVAEAVEIAEGAGWEVNVRYWPYCVADKFGFARNCVNFYGTQLDHWEWALVATNQMPAAQVQQFGGIHAANMAYCNAIAQGRTNPVCESCKFHAICEGVPEQYQARYGLGELRPVTGDAVRDYLYFENGGKYE